MTTYLNTQVIAGKKRVEAYIDPFGNLCKRVLYTRAVYEP